jgi:hypothetical protein
LCMCIPFGLDAMHNDVVGARWRAFCCSFWVLCDYDAPKGNRWEFSALDGLCFFSSSSQGLTIGTCMIAAGTNLMWICSNCTSAVNFRAPGHKHHVPLQQLHICSILQTIIRSWQHKTSRDDHTLGVQALIE